MIKIEGLATLTRDLEEAQRAFAELEGEIGTVSFNPTDPASIESAIQEMEQLIDGRLGTFTSNPIVAPMIEGIKDKYRQAIVDKAAVARLEGNQPNGE